MLCYFIGAKVLMFCLQFGAICVGPGCRRLTCPTVGAVVRIAFMRCYA